jgi:hypothetical protein
MNLSSRFSKDPWLILYKTLQEGCPLCEDIEFRIKIFKMAFCTMVTNQMLKYKNEPCIITAEQEFHETS